MLGKTFLHRLVLIAFVSVIAVLAPLVAISCNKSTTLWKVPWVASTLLAALTLAAVPMPAVASSAALWTSSFFSATRCRCLSPSSGLQQREIQRGLQKGQQLERNQHPHPGLGPCHLWLEQGLQE